MPFSHIIEPVELTERLLLLMKEYGCLHKYITAMTSTYIDLFRFSLSKSAKAKNLWTTLEDYIPLLNTSPDLEELYAIRQGRYFHKLMREHKAMKQHLDYVYSRSFFSTLRYIRYYILSKFPSKRRERYLEKYSLLKKQRLA